jgi:hypothetical protein
MRRSGLPHGGAFTALLVMALTACGSSYGSDSRDGRNRVSASAVSSSAGSSTVSMVSCTGSTCSVTLGGAGAGAHVLGTDISLRTVQGRRVTLRVGEATVTCAPGDSVAAGALRLTCSSVADGVVELIASSR